MNALQTAEPRKNRFQITRLEERIAPAPSPIAFQHGLVNVSLQNNEIVKNVAVNVAALNASPVIQGL